MSPCKGDNLLQRGSLSFEVKCPGRTVCFEVKFPGDSLLRSNLPPGHFTSGGKLLRDRRVFALIRSSVPQQLASFPGLKTDRDRLLSSSLRSFSGPPCFLLCPGLTQPVLCCFNSVPGALSHSILRFSLRLLRCLRGSLREHNCAISTIDPRSFTLRTSISTTP